MTFGFKSGLATIFICLAVTCPVGAAEPFPDFTFKRVKPPSGDSKNRINIQITPQSTTAPQDVVAIVSKPTSDQTGWFWDTISPDLSARAPGRFQLAANAVGLAPEAASLGTPRLQTLRTISETYGREILLATIGKRVSPALVLAMIGTESSGRASAESTAGAKGLMQLMPATAARFGVTDLTDPAENIKGGVTYLEWLLEKFDNDPILALAAYNAGENAVLDNDGVPPYSETRAYVPKVVAAFQVARALCMTPPELFTDGCVFALGGQTK